MHYPARVWPIAAWSPWPRSEPVVPISARCPCFIPFNIYLLRQCLFPQLQLSCNTTKLVEGQPAADRKVSSSRVKA